MELAAAFACCEARSAERKADGIRSALSRARRGLDNAAFTSEVFVKGVAKKFFYRAKA
jgi:hypothetical protein